LEFRHFTKMAKCGEGVDVDGSLMEGVSYEFMIP